MKQEDLVNLAYNILKMAFMNDTSMDTTMDVSNDVSTPESAGKSIEITVPSNNINDDATRISNTDQPVIQPQAESNTDQPIIQPQAESKTLDDIYASIVSLTKAIQLSNVNNANQPDISSVESIADIQQQLLR